MSENKTGAPAPDTSAPAAEDRFKNLQKEMDRKLDNVQSTLKASNDQLLAQIQSMLKPKVPEVKESSEDLETLMYTKPAEAMRKIKEEAKNEIRSEIDARDAETLKRNTVMQSLYNEYPELGIQDSELYRTAVKKYDEMAKEYGHSPAAYKAAVAEAALETGTRPKSKRSSSDDDSYSLSGSSSSRGNRAERHRSDELTPLEKLAAEAMGVDPERVKARKAKKTNLTKWG